MASEPVRRRPVMAGGHLLPRWMAMPAAMLVILGFVGLFAADSVDAQTVKIVGYGAASCVDFLRDYARDVMSERVYFAWAQGYMSGILMKAPIVTDDHVDLTPPDLLIRVQMSFVHQYCAEHDSSDYSDAVTALYRRLGGVSVK